MSGLGLQSCHQEGGSQDSEMTSKKTEQEKVALSEKDAETNVKEKFVQTNSRQR